MCVCQALSMLNKIDCWNLVFLEEAKKKARLVFFLARTENFKTSVLSGSTTDSFEPFSRVSNSVIQTTNFWRWGERERERFSCFLVCESATSSTPLFLHMHAYMTLNNILSSYFFLKSCPVLNFGFFFFCCFGISGIDYATQFFQRSLGCSSAHTECSSNSSNTNISCTCCCCCCCSSPIFRCSIWRKG